MKVRVAVIAFCLLLVGCARPTERAAPAPEASVVVEDFDFLVGTWHGALDYLDYGDDRSRVELPTHVVYARDDALRFEFVFTEPSGAEMKDGGTLVVNEAGEIVTAGETYRLVRKQLDPASESYQVVFSGPGRDNNQEAMITHTVERRGDMLTIQKEVVYDGSAAPLLRHEFRLTRQR